MCSNTLFCCSNLQCRYNNGRQTCQYGFSGATNAGGKPLTSGAEAAEKKPSMSGAEAAEKKPSMSEAEAAVKKPSSGDAKDNPLISGDNGSAVPGKDDSGTP